MKGVLKVSKEQVIDVHGKRFNTHGELDRMEMTISKDHVAGKPRRGRASGGTVAHDLVNECQAPA